VSEPNNNDWLERELARQMKPARAPESLWGRIESGRSGAPGSRRSSLQAAARQTGWILWPAVALVLFLASGDLLWEIGKARASMAPLTEQDLSSLTDVSACDIRSTDPDVIARWVKANTNRDVTLSCGRSGSAHPVGARLIRRHGALVAAVAYRAGGGTAAVLVSGKHSFFGWNRDYAVAWFPGSRNAGMSPEACDRCHLDARSQM
jgi:hypothetical protein